MEREVFSAGVSSCHQTPQRPQWCQSRPLAVNSHPPLSKLLILNAIKLNVIRSRSSELNQSSFLVSFSVEKFPQVIYLSILVLWFSYNTVCRNLLVYFQMCTSFRWSGQSRLCFSWCSYVGWRGCRPTSYQVREERPHLALVWKSSIYQMDSLNPVRIVIRTFYKISLYTVI